MSFAAAVALTIGMSTTAANAAPVSHRSPSVAALPADEPPADSDGDGITDDVDACPNEVGLPEYAGCPYVYVPTDSDGDGVADDTDQCPADPGSATYGGCPVPDSDGDGISDEVDACPTLPGPNDGCPLPDFDGDGVYDDGTDQCPNQAGPADNNGCPYGDSDGDGITDDVDGCPGTPQGENVDPAGCSLTQQDSDNDGVNDELDQCDATPADAEIDQSGCAASERDTDSDGVHDDADKCVTVAGPTANGGCPLTAVAPTAVRFVDRCGTRNDRVVIPAKQGVTYRSQGAPLRPGSYARQGSVTVTARAKAGYTLTGTTRWSTTFSARACRVGSIQVVSTKPRTVRVTNGERVPMSVRVGRVTTTVAAGSSRTLKVGSGRRAWTATWDGDQLPANGWVRVR